MGHPRGGVAGLDGIEIEMTEPLASFLLFFYGESTAGACSRSNLGNVSCRPHVTGVQLFGCPSWVQFFFSSQYAADLGSSGRVS